MSRGNEISRRAIKELAEGQFRISFLATHGGNAEGIAGAVLGYSAERPMQSFDQIGGIFHEYDLATLAINKTRSGACEATYKKGDFKTRVDISHIV